MFCEKRRPAFHHQASGVFFSVKTSGPSSVSQVVHEMFEAFLAPSLHPVLSGEFFINGPKWAFVQTQS